MPIPELHAEPLAEWWTEDHDRALVVGTLKHGFGKYSEIRDDVDLPFAVNFAGKIAPEPKKEKKMKHPVEDEIAIAETETEAVNAEPEWIHGRFLSNRVKRVFNVLGGKSYEPPPKIERPVKPKVPKAPKLPREKKPKGAPRSGSGTTMEKLLKAQTFLKESKRDNDGNLRMPIGPVSGVMIECLGEIKNKKDFVTQQYILPVGFKTVRVYPRLDNLGRAL